MNYDYINKMYEKALFWSYIVLQLLSQDLLVIINNNIKNKNTIEGKMPFVLFLFYGIFIFVDLFL